METIVPIRKHPFMDTTHTLYRVDSHDRRYHVTCSSMCSIYVLLVVEFICTVYMYYILVVEFICTVYMYYILVVEFICTVYMYYW